MKLSIKIVAFVIFISLSYSISSKDIQEILGTKKDAVVFSGNYYFISTTTLIKLKIHRTLNDHPILFVIVKTEHNNMFTYDIYEFNDLQEKINNSGKFVNPNNNLEIKTLYYLIKHPYEINKLEYIANNFDLANNDNFLFGLISNLDKTNEIKYSQDLTTIGLLYLFSNEIETQKELAIKYFKLSASLNNIEAKYCLHYIRKMDKNSDLSDNNYKLARNLLYRITPIKNFYEKNEHINDGKTDLMDAVEIDNKKEIKKLLNSIDKKDEENLRVFAKNIISISRNHGISYNFDANYLALDLILDLVKYNKEKNLDLLIFIHLVIDKQKKLETMLLNSKKLKSTLDLDEFKAFVFEEINSLNQINNPNLGRNDFMNAIMENNLDIAKIILDNEKINNNNLSSVSDMINKIDCEGNNVLNYAIFNNNLEALDFLLSLEEINLDNPNTIDLLFEKNDQDLINIYVKNILKRNKEEEIINISKKIKSFAKENIDFGKEFVELYKKIRSSLINITFNKIDTNSTIGNIKNLLVNLGTKIKDEKGNNLLHHATIKRNPKLFQQLLALDKDLINQKNNLNLNPLDLIVSQNALNKYIDFGRLERINRAKKKLIFDLEENINAQDQI